jgi:hypothetical protein
MQAKRRLAAAQDRLCDCDGFGQFRDQPGAFNSVCTWYSAIEETKDGIQASVRRSRSRDTSAASSAARQQSDPRPGLV